MAGSFPPLLPLFYRPKSQQSRQESHFSAVPDDFIFIIQIYHEREYDPIRAMGFRNLIYTLYRAEDEERNLWRIAHFAEMHELVGITTQKEMFQSAKHRIAMAHCGIPFMFHTVDDEEEIEKMLQKPYVMGIYTDLT